MRKPHDEDWAQLGLVATRDSCEYRKQRADLESPPNQTWKSWWAKSEGSRGHMIPKPLVHASLLQSPPKNSFGAVYQQKCDFAAGSGVWHSVCDYGRFKHRKTKHNTSGSHHAALSLKIKKRYCGQLIGRNGILTVLTKKNNRKLP